MKKLITVLLPALALVLFAATPVMAEDGKVLFTQKGCSFCHGADARTTRGPDYPILAGQHKDYILSQLHEFKAKRRTSVRSKEMVPFANSLSEAQMEAVAEYLSSL